jgi:hypothetical protein
MVMSRHKNAGKVAIYWLFINLLEMWQFKYLEA